MWKLLIPLITSVTLFLLGPPAQAEALNEPVEQFDREVRQLAAALDIHGLAYVIVQDGTPVASRSIGVQRGSGTPFDTDTPLRIASVTKALTAVAAMQLAEEGKLDLGAKANGYDRSLGLPEEISVRHLLTHTSEGVPGEGFVYGTTRFSKLGPVLAAADGQPFETILRKRVADRAGMRWYSSEGLGAHAALVSTVDDMGRFIQALDRGKLISHQSLQRLGTPSLSNSSDALPVSLGWFAQEVQGVPVMWSFGQDDPEHSGALLVRLPQKKLSLFLLANSNLVSDPFRLLAGDVRRSPFAMSFLRLFAFSNHDALLPPLQTSELPAWLDARERSSTYSYSDELAAWALIDAWRGNKAAAESKFKLLVSRYKMPPDRVLHFAVMQFDLEELRPKATVWGQKLLALQPGDRWLRLAQGYLLQRSGNTAAAAEQFEAVLSLANQEPDFLHLLFQNWSWLALAELHKGSDPELSKTYLRQAIASGVKGPTLESAKEVLASLEQPASAKK